LPLCEPYASCQIYNTSL